LGSHEVLNGTRRHVAVETGRCERVEQKWRRVGYPVLRLAVGDDLFVHQHLVDAVQHLVQKDHVLADPMLRLDDNLPRRRGHVDVTEGAIARVTALHPAPFGAQLDPTWNPPRLAHAPALPRSVTRASGIA